MPDAQLGRLRGIAVRVGHQHKASSHGPGQTCILAVTARQRPHDSCIPIAGRFMNHPVWLKVVCIVSIVLGSLGLLMSIAGLVGQLSIERTNDATLRLMESLQQGAAPQPMIELQKELQSEIVAIQQRFMPLNLVLLGGNVLVAGALLAGGIQALRMKPAGRKLLLAALIAAAVFEVVRVPPTAFMQWQMSKLMSPFMQRIMDAGTPPGTAVPPAQRRFMDKMARSVMVTTILIGIVTALSMAAVKIAFYVAGAWLLRRPHVRAMYLPEPAVAEVMG